MSSAAGDPCDAERRPSKRSRRQRNETLEQREARLARRRLQYRARRSAETADDREARLQRQRAATERRLARKTPEEREARLQHLRTNQQLRLARETPEERDARLQQLRANRQERLAAETPEERDARRQHDREYHMQPSISTSSETPLLYQTAIQHKIMNFHWKLAALEVPTCTTCMESFPGMTVRTTSTGKECLRCCRDKHSPKTYSSDNNMHPGPVPQDLQVIYMLISSKLCCYAVNMLIIACLCDNLQGLKQTEEMLISAVMPIMSIYKLPHGQYSCSGHVVNLPQDVVLLAQKLPRLPSNLDVLVVRKEGANQTHIDFRVRRVVVKRALQWLMTHNQYYQALGITPPHLTLPQPHQALRLPLRKTPPHLTLPQTHQALRLPLRKTLRQRITISFVPIAAPSMTEQETVQQSVEERQSRSSSSTPLM